MSEAKKRGLKWPVCTILILALVGGMIYWGYTAFETEQAMTQARSVRARASDGGRGDSRGDPARRLPLRVAPVFSGGFRPRHDGDSGQHHLLLVVAQGLGKAADATARRKKKSRPPIRIKSPLRKFLSFTPARWRRGTIDSAPRAAPTSSAPRNSPAPCGCPRRYPRFSRPPRNRRGSPHSAR